MFEEVFTSEVSFSLFSNGVTTFLAALGAVSLGISTTGAVDGCSLVVSTVSWGACSSFPLFACISSNHFSNIGIASSRLGVPDEEIFCFPSI